MRTVGRFSHSAGMISRRPSVRPLLVGSGRAQHRHSAGAAWRLARAKLGSAQKQAATSVNRRAPTASPGRMPLRPSNGGCATHVPAATDGPACVRGRDPHSPQQPSGCRRQQSVTGGASVCRRRSFLGCEPGRRAARSSLRRRAAAARISLPGACIPSS